MPPTSTRDAALRAHLVAAGADLTTATRTEQEATLDDAFRACGLTPTWEEWHAYAREYLPAYRRAAIDGERAGTQ